MLESAELSAISYCDLSGLEGSQVEFIRRARISTGPVSQEGCQALAEVMCVSPMVPGAGAVTTAGLQAMFMERGRTDVSLVELIDESGVRCGLALVSLSRRAPHPVAAVVDHLIGENVTQEGDAVLMWYSISPSHRGRKLGIPLLAVVVGMARRAGCSRMIAFLVGHGGTLEKERPLQEQRSRVTTFLVRRGFHPRCPILGKGSTVAYYVMEKRLAPMSPTVPVGAGVTHSDGI